MQTRKLTVLALLAAAALIIHTIEGFLPPPLPIPGIRLGLANIITLFVLCTYSYKEALAVLIVRIVLASLFFGQAVSFTYSLAGGFMCLIVMGLINSRMKGHFVFLTGVFGALTHNMTQIMVARFLTGTSGVFVYVPYLAISAVVTGLFTGLCAHFLLKHLRRLLRDKSIY